MPYGKFGPSNDSKESTGNLENRQLLGGCGLVLKYNSQPSLSRGKNIKIEKTTNQVASTGESEVDFYGA